MRAGIVRSIALVAAGALVATACGSTDDASGETAPPPSTTSSPTTSLSPTTTATGADDTSEAVTGLESDGDSDGGEAPVAPLEDDQTTGDIEPLRRLSIADSLLADDAFPAPWEFQWREVDRTGWSSGPNQTDCDEYWELESLLGSAGGHAMWWVDGGNVNHHVIRMADETEILAKLLAFASLAETCPTVTWTEGGSFSVQGYEFDEALGFRFDDESSGETTWVLVTTSGDLISLLWIPLWTNVDGTKLDLPPEELERLAALMFEQLSEAGPAEEGVVVTTEPPVVPPPPVTDPPVEPTGLGSLLLTEDELPAGWELDDVEPYTSSPTDDELIASCPAAESIDRVDVELEWEAEFSSDVVGTTAFELIGEMSDAGTAEAAVREFSTVWECDITVVIDDATTSGGLIDVAGADVAGLLVIEADELLGARLELVLASFGPIVVVVSQETAAADPWSLVDGLLPPASAKIAASG